MKAPEEIADKILVLMVRSFSKSSPNLGNVLSHEICFANHGSILNPAFPLRFS